MSFTKFFFTPKFSRSTVVCLYIIFIQCLHVVCIEQLHEQSTALVGIIPVHNYTIDTYIHMYVHTMGSHSNKACRTICDCDQDF